MFGLGDGYSIETINTGHGHLQVTSGRGLIASSGGVRLIGGIVLDNRIVYHARSPPYSRFALPISITEDVLF